MKKLILLVFLIISLNSFTQNTDNLVFDKISKDAVWEYSDFANGSVSSQFDVDSSYIIKRYKVITIIEHCDFLKKTSYFTCYSCF